MTEKFRLKWEDFQSNISKSFRRFRSQEEELCDVNLLGDDQVQVSAHRLVLSASSPYFRSDYVHLDVEDCSEELLRQQSYAMKNQLGLPPTRFFMA